MVIPTINPSFIAFSIPDSLDSKYHGCAILGTLLEDVLNWLGKLT
ncbi:hypothetical protein MTsPCn5_25100 [Croceitalea sp. MTPC5]|nr:hypothetical protein MTsPCn5_25100 [Croceitalea sp. MTPC5]